jgi:Single Cache domain 2
MVMIRGSIIDAFTMNALLMPEVVFAQSAEFGTAAEAKAMLEKVVVSIKADPANTIAQINKGQGGFRDCDLYPFCAGPDGKVVAHADPSRIGLVLRDNKDAHGKPYGAEFTRVAEEGKFSEVDYVFPRPGPDKTPVPKSSFVTKVAGHLCGVGYYR